MNAKETLEKYGLKTDVKSIRERMESRSYKAIATAYVVDVFGNPFDEDTDAQNNVQITMVTVELRSADLSLLCELAEKGERYEKAVKELDEKVISLREIAEQGRFMQPYIAIIIDGIDGVLDKIHIITEAEGEPR